VPSTDNSKPSQASTIPHLNAARPLPASLLSARASRSLRLSPPHHLHPPTTQLAPTMAPRTRLTTVFRALLAHLYIRRSPVPAPTPEERTQVTYDPIEYSCSSGDSVGSDDIPWAEHVRDGSDNTAQRGKTKAASI